jgi:hypothetical protein
MVREKKIGLSFYLPVGFCCMVLLGCSSQVPLTKSLIREYKLTQTDIQRLQLYVSEGILLEQEATTVNKDVDATHALKTVKDSYVKQVYFKRRTPCIAVEVRPDNLYVAFEPGGQLGFKYDRSHSSDGAFIFRPDTRFKQEKELDRVPGSGFRNWKFIGKEQYKGTSFNVLISHRDPYLLVDEKGLKKLIVEKHTVPGMRQMTQ